MKNQYNKFIETGKTYGPFATKFRMEAACEKDSDKYICSCKCGRELILTSFQLATGSRAVCPSCGAKIDSPICEKPKYYGAPTSEALDLKFREERAATLVATGVDPCGTYAWCSFCDKSCSTPCARAHNRYLRASKPPKPRAPRKPSTKPPKPAKAKYIPGYKVGDVIDKLEILALTPRGYSCRCVDCQTERVYTPSQVKAGKCLATHHDKDVAYLGKQFGELTVIKRVYRWQPQARGSYSTSFLCKCSCGHTAIRSTRDLNGSNPTGKTCGWAKCIAKLIGADICDTQAYMASVAPKYDDAKARQALDGKPHAALEFAKAIRFFNGSNWGINIPNYAHSPSGIAGVNKHPNGTYRAQIGWQYANIVLGFFPTLPEAALIRKEAEVYLRHATELELAKIYGGPQMSLDDKLALIGLDVNTRALDVVRGAV